MCCITPPSPRWQGRRRGGGRNERDRDFSKLKNSNPEDGRPLPSDRQRSFAASVEPLSLFSKNGVRRQREKEDSAVVIYGGARRLGGNANSFFSRSRISRTDKELEAPAHGLD